MVTNPQNSDLSESFQTDVMSGFHPAPSFGTSASGHDRIGRFRPKAEVAHLDILSPLE
jgi:hypothetical protein